MVRDFAIAANLFNGDKRPRPSKGKVFCFAFLILGLAFADICASLIGPGLQAMRDPEHRSRARHRQNLRPNAAILRMWWVTPSLFFCSVERCRVIAAGNCDSMGQPVGGVVYIEEKQADHPTRLLTGSPICQVCLYRLHFKLQMYLFWTKGSLAF